MDLLSNTYIRGQGLAHYPQRAPVGRLGPRAAVKTIMVPTYVELVWGCSNASFGILRPGFRFLPIGKDVRTKLKIYIIAREQGQRQPQKAKSCRRHALSSPGSEHRFLPRQSVKAPATTACPTCKMASGMTFSPTRTHQGKNANALFPGRCTLSSCWEWHCKLFFFFHRIFMMADDVGNRSIWGGLGGVGDFFHYFCGFLLLFNVNQMYVSVLQFSKLICEQLLNLMMDVK